MKTQPERLLDHPTRKRILDFIREHPGANLRMLTRGLGANRGTATYHLRLLEEAQIVKSLEVGRDRHLFGPGEARSDEYRISLLQNPSRRGIVQVILENPGIIQKELSRRAGMSRKVARQQLAALREAHLVEPVRETRFKRYYPTDVLRELWTRVGKP